MATEEDAWRFADVTNKKLEKSVGAYGCDLVPATSTKSTTGTQRGEQLFARPELYRPWRSPEKQRSAAAIVGKEQEIEHLTRRNNELRAENAAFSRELQKTQQKVKILEQGQLEAHLEEKRQLNDTISTLKREVETLKSSSEQQLHGLRTHHENERYALQNRVKAAQDGANEAGTLYAKQVTEIKAAAAREVALVQQLGVARQGELQNELDGTKASLRLLQERTAELLADAQAETRRTEERCVGQLREQERRFELQRSQLHNEIQTLEAERNALRTELHDSRERTNSASFDATQTESRFKDWNVRLLTDLEQLYEYYQAAVREVAAEAEPASLVPISTLPGGSNDPTPTTTDPSTLKGVMERVAERLQQLTQLKQQHTIATHVLLKKIRALEASSSQSADLFRRTAEEKDMQVSRLHTEVAEAKAHQQRLEAALAETGQMAREADAAARRAAYRLNFFSDDLRVALSHVGPDPPVAPSGNVTFVAMYVDGASVLWEECPGPMQAAMAVCHDVLRGKARQYGGYEFANEGGSLVMAFQHPLEAVRFALESQEWLLRARWPPEIFDHHAGQEQRSEATGAVVFRGLRVGMALHRGEVSKEETNVPIGIAAGRVAYFGLPLTQLLQVTGLAAGGQVLASGAVWSAVATDVDQLGPISAADLGQHRIVSEAARSAFGGAETMSLYQLLPESLADRGFHGVKKEPEEATSTSEGLSVASHFSHTARGAVAAEVASLRERSKTLKVASDTLDEETKAVATSIETLVCKVRETQVHGRIYSQSDMIAQAAAVDRIVARTDAVRRDVDRVLSAQADVHGAQRSLEEQTMLHTKVLMNDDEFKKKLEVAHDRGNERLHEQAVQSGHQLQQLRNALQKAEATVNDLRRQVMMAPLPPTSSSGVAPPPATASNSNPVRRKPSVEPRRVTPVVLEAHSKASKRPPSAPKTRVAELAKPKRSASSAKVHVK